MSLIASFLKYFFERTRHTSELGVTFIKDESILFTVETFSNTNHRNVELEFTQHLFDAVHLSFTAVDNQKIWKWPHISLRSTSLLR